MVFAAKRLFQQTAKVVLKGLLFDQLMGTRVFLANAYIGEK